ncbi:MAG: hypothetical protein EU539_11865 [Promethearchaeota archaeon]|nr:MAG: hypothetical protein EU539_11865 [Candidatus Lokiarchaeota archaeon]
MEKEEDKENEVTESSEEEEEKTLIEKLKSKIGSKKPQKRSQTQVLQEKLNLEPGTLENIEKKLFVARFIDYFSEETFDFVYRDKEMKKYLEQINEILENVSDKTEEDKLLNQSFENKQINIILEQLKEKAEESASEKDINKSIDKRMRNLSIYISIPMLVLVFVLSFFIDYIILFPILCVFCMAPNLIRSYLVKKWQTFKEENKMEFYTNNREDIMILKGFVGDILENVRSKLLDLKIPLQLIKFVLHSRDYENLEVINQKAQKGTTQFFVQFVYPEGVEPFPIPESLAQQYESTEKALEEIPEKNFIVFKNIKAKDGIIDSFVPTLKDNLADEINDMLNKCEFTKATQDESIILPNYSPEMAIYCMCGEIVEIDNVQVCNWKNEFKFYLFEGKECDCGEKVYALSLMDEEQEVPEELENIFN